MLILLKTREPPVAFGAPFSLTTPLGIKREASSSSSRARALNTQLITNLNWFEAGRGAAARGVTAKPTGCGFDPHSRRWNIYLNLYFHFFALVSRLSAALSSATQHAMPPEFGREWGTECLNTRFPLPTLLCPGYSVKLMNRIHNRR